jgi:hypothetical protein
LVVVALYLKHIFDVLFIAYSPHHVVCVSPAISPRSLSIKVFGSDTRTTYLKEEVIYVGSEYLGILIAVLVWDPLLNLTHLWLC